LNHRVKIAAIVLAAGEGRRMGGPKALVPIGETTFLAHVCRLFERPSIAAVVAVLGAESERVRALANLPDAVRVEVNEDWKDGMLSSVWRGLDAAEALAADAVLLHPVDNPLVVPVTIEAVASALATGARVAVPSHAGRRGHPTGFSRATWPALRAAPLERGARLVIAENPSWIVHVPAGPDCLADIDTPDDQRRLLG
jgi:CTP:molybdopterin cytidylyltransferase MocA